MALMVEAIDLLQLHISINRGEQGPITQINLDALRETLVRFDHGEKLGLTTYI